MDINKLLGTLIFLLITGLTFSQTVEMKNNAAGVYFNFKTNKTVNSTKLTDSTYSDDISRDYNVFTVTPYFRVIAKNPSDFYELELSDLHFLRNELRNELVYFQVTDTSNGVTASKRNVLEKKVLGNSSDFGLAVRYEYSINLTSRTGEKKKAELYLGIGTELAYKLTNTQTFTNTDYFYKTQTVAGNIFLIPRFVYNFNENIFIDINIPLHWNEFGYVFTNSNDPSTPKSNFWDVGYKNNYGLRVGLGLRF